MEFKIRPLGNGFVGEVSGINITRPVSKSVIAAIETGMDKFAVLVFHDQQLTDSQQMEFSRNFGELQVSITDVTKRGDRRLPIGMQDISNLDQNSDRFKQGDRRRLYNLGNRLWHSDASFKAIPAKYSLLSARQVPAHGGDTQFADMRAAYDDLDGKIKQAVSDLVCEHSLLYSRAILGFDFNDDEIRDFAPVRQVLERTHPMTGRKSLFLAAHIGSIVGWPRPEAMAYIRDLLEHATQDKFVYTHHWKIYDLIIWDNRQTMHRGRPFPQDDEVRDLRRTTVMGDGPTAEQTNAALASVDTELEY
jgi:alpha-ketoglutarate-dependent 2,4-dichlorophenoxyacetate dioxygenase